MSLGKLKIIAMSAIVLLAAASCKEEEQESLPSLSGLYFECPMFAAPGKAVTLTPKEVEHPEGGEVGYCWRVTPTMKRNDTTRVYVHWFSDTLKTYTVSCYAFAEGYNATSYSRKVEVVASGLDGSLTETGIKASDKKVTVDGIDYYYEKIGSLEWFRNNLADPQSGAPYVNEEIVSDICFSNFACEGVVLAEELDLVSQAVCAAIRLLNDNAITQVVHLNQFIQNKEYLTEEFLTDENGYAIIDVIEPLTQSNIKNSLINPLIYFNFSPKITFVAMATKEAVEKLEEVYA